MREVMMRRVNQYVILSLIAAMCVACGVRGALTVEPKPAKGIVSSATNPAASSIPDLRTSPASAVLFGADGKQTVIPVAAPDTK